MNRWKAILPAAALILGGAACERKDYNAKEYSRNDSGIEESAKGMRDDASAANNPAANDRHTMTGKLDVQDDDARTFILEGNSQTYVAPQQADLDELDGEQVTVMIDPNGRVVAIQKAADREG